MIRNGYQPTSAGTDPTPPTTGSGVKPPPGLEYPADAMRQANEASLKLAEEVAALREELSAADEMNHNLRREIARLRGKLDQAEACMSIVEPREAKVGRS